MFYEEEFRFALAATHTLRSPVMSSCVTFSFFPFPRRKEKRGGGCGMKEGGRMAGRKVAKYGFEPAENICTMFSFYCFYWPTDLVTTKKSSHLLELVWVNLFREDGNSILQSFTIPIHCMCITTTVETVIQCTVCASQPLWRL